MAGEARVHGIASLRRKLGLLTEAEAEATNREVRRSAVAIQAGAKKRVKVDRGELRNSISIEVRSRASAGLSNDGASAAIGTNKPHGPAVEFGRRAGKKMPPVEEIRAWARRKGIPEDAAFAIARKIAREGTPAAPFLFPAFEEERPKFVRRLAASLDQAHRRVSG